MGVAGWVGALLTLVVFVAVLVVTFYAGVLLLEIDFRNNFVAVLVVVVGNVVS